MRDAFSEVIEFLYREEKTDSKWLSSIRDWLTVIFFVLLSYFFIDNYGRFSVDTRYTLFHLNSVALLVFCLRRFVFNREYYPLEERIPLYTCNIAAIVMPLNYIFSILNLRNPLWEVIFTWGLFAGLYGGPLAIIFASPGEYEFPHFTRLAYYVEHAGIFFLGLIYVFEREVEFSEELLILSCLITVVYLVIMDLYVNPKLGSNYGFITEAPRGVEFLNNLPKGLYKFLCIGLYVGFNIVTWKIANTLI